MRVHTSLLTCALSTLASTSAAHQTVEVSLQRIVGTGDPMPGGGFFGGRYNANFFPTGSFGSPALHNGDLAFWGSDGSAARPHVGNQGIFKIVGATATRIAGRNDTPMPGAPPLPDGSAVRFQIRESLSAGESGIGVALSMTRSRVPARSR